MSENKEEKLSSATEHQSTDEKSVQNEVSIPQDAPKTTTDELVEEIQETKTPVTAETPTEDVGETAPTSEKQDTEEVTATTEVSKPQDTAETASDELVAETPETETPVTAETPTEDIGETVPTAETQETPGTTPLMEDKNQKSDSQKAVDEVEKHVAEKSEKAVETPEIPMEDYNTLDLETIVKTISKLIEEHPIQAINKHIDALKKAFNTKFGILLAEAKAKFLADAKKEEKESEESEEVATAPSEFKYENPIQKQYNDVLFDYKKKRKAYYNDLDKQYEDNLRLKIDIIEELKKLIDEGDANSMYNNFQTIQNSWRAVGPVSRVHYSDTWRTYHFHVERFYDLLHLRNDLRDLDFKHNLEEKTKLVEKAEALAELDDVKVAFDELQTLHQLWKEKIGPVSREHREVIWERFSNATKKIHDKKHEFYEELHAEFEENALMKEAVIAEIEAYDTSKNKTHRDWQKSMKDIEKFRDLFFKIGKVPRSKNKKIWNKFKDATSAFNAKKNDFYKEAKSIQKDNLDRKMKLVEIAESYRDSDDWAMATDTMKRIQTEWKTIGHVPRKFSDKIWNRFREACNHYFERLHAKDDEANAEKFVVYQNKKDYLEKLKTAASAEGFAPDIAELKNYIKEWRELGSVPREQRYIDGKFNKFLDPYFDKLSLNKQEGTMLRYRSMIDGFVEQNDFRKISNEIQFVRNKIDSVTKEKQQLENNMLFFSNADDSNPMFKNIKNTLTQHENDLEEWQGKLQYLRTIEV